MKKAISLIGLLMTLAIPSGLLAQQAGYSQTNLVSNTAGVGFDDHRSVSVAIPVGEVSSAQGRRQDAYSATVRLNVEENQLVNVFGEFTVCIGSLKSA